MNQKLLQITRRLILVVMVLAILPVSAQGFIFKNTINGSNPSTFNPFTDGQETDPNVSATGIGRGTGLVAGAEVNAYSVSSWNTPAVDNTAYFEFTITPNPGYQIDYGTLEYNLGFSGGPNNAPAVVRSNLGDYITNIPQSRASFATPVIVDLSAAAYQNVTSSVTFRIYPFGSANASDRFTIYDFTFKGTVEQRLGVTDFVQPTFHLYPNPVVNELHIEGLTNIKHFEVLNMSGQQLIIQNVNDFKATTDLSALASGIYLIKMTTNNNTKTIKIVKR